MNGWVQRRRDHGMVLFIDLRDRTGLTQVVFNAERNAAVHQAHIPCSVVNASCRSPARSWPVPRSPATASADGRLKIFVDAVEILNEAKTPPFAIEDDIEITESLRLKYRYLSTSGDPDATVAGIAARDHAGCARF